MGWRLGWPKPINAVWLGPMMALTLGVVGKLLGAPELDNRSGVVAGVVDAAVTGLFAMTWAQRWKS